MAVLLVQPFLQFFDNNGDPLSGGKVHTYAAGTTTRKATYTDASGSVLAPNPLILDAAGRAQMWGSGAYKFVVQDANGMAVGPNGGVTDNVQTFTVTSSAGSSYSQVFSGDGVTNTFTLSRDMGTDANALMVFIDEGMNEYCANGQFGTDTIWTKGTGWVIGSGVATATTASTALSQTAVNTITAGQLYTVTYTVTRSAGDVTPSIGGINGVTRNAAGTYNETIVAGNSQTIAFTGNGFTGTLDNISVRKVMSSGMNIIPPSTISLNGNQLTINPIPPNGTGNILVMAPSTLVGAASASAAQAEEAKNAAENAQVAAEDARDIAIQAKDDAIIAKDDAIQAKDDAQQTLNDAIALYQDLQAVEDAVDEAEYWALVSQSASLPPSNWVATTNPTATDDFSQGWGRGSRWLNTVTNKLFTCTDNTNGAAVWFSNPTTAEVQAIADTKQPLAPRVQTVTSAATVTPTSDNDEVVITAQASALLLANPTGTMVQGQALVVRVKDNGTARAITYDTAYRAIGFTLPATTFINKILYLYMIWNSTDAKFDVVGFAREA